MSRSSVLASLASQDVSASEFDKLDADNGSDYQSQVDLKSPLASPTFTGSITTPEIRSGATLTIDPATVGDNTGLVLLKGNLQVDGTSTTINSTTLTVDDLNLTLASGAADSAAANGAGITIDGASATMIYTHSTTSFDFNKPVNVGGALGATGALSVNTSTEDMAVFTGGVGVLTLRHGIDLEFNRADTTYITNNNASGDLELRTGGQNNRLHIDSAGNLAIGGVTPVATHTDEVSFRVGGLGMINAPKAATAGKSMRISNNVQLDTDDSYEYMITDEASLYSQYGGAHRFYTAASGTAGNDITFKTPLQLSSDGNVNIGGIAAGEQLTLDGGSGVTSGYIGWRGNGAHIGFIGGGAGLGASAGDFVVRGTTNIKLNIGGSTKATLNSSGYVGIGTTAPEVELDLGAGQIRLDNTKFIYWDDSGGVLRNAIRRDSNEMQYWSVPATGNGNGTHQFKVGSDGGTPVNALNINHDGKIGVYTNNNIGWIRSGAQFTINHGTQLSINSINMSYIMVYMPSSGHGMTVAGTYTTTMDEKFNSNTSLLTGANSGSKIRVWKSADSHTGYIENQTGGDKLIQIAIYAAGG